jgi:hypothetical protein
MDFIEIIKDINYFSYVIAFAKWIFIFLMLSVVLLIVCARLGFFKRNAKIARYLVNAYYILIPIYFVGFALKYAPIKNTQIEINKSIDENKQVISDFAYKFISSIVSDSVLSQENSAKDIVNQYLDNCITSIDTVAKPKANRFFGGFFMKIKRKLEYSFLIRLVESEIIEESAQLIGLSKKTGKALYRTDLNQLFMAGGLVEIFKMEMNKYFRAYFRFSFFIFSLGLLIPTIEIILAKTLKY